MLHTQDPDGTAIGETTANPSKKAKTVAPKSGTKKAKVEKKQKDPIKPNFDVKAETLDVTLFGKTFNFTR